VLEGKLDRRRGPVATVLVQNGTLHVGDVVVVGKTWGKIRALEDEDGDRHRTAPPGVPAMILGLNDVPKAGERLEVVSEERTARAIAEKRAEEARMEAQAASRGALTLDDFAAMMREGEAKELNVIVKTDVQGSIEPIVGSLEALEAEEATVNVVHAAAGNITESDINLAVASGAIALGFRVNIDTAARRMADEEGIEINLYDVIYKLIDEVEQAMKGLLEPKIVEKRIGAAQVRAIFNIPSAGTIAGCYVANGVVRRNAKVRVFRDGGVMYDGEIASLRRFEEDVREVRQGYECGIKVEGFNDVREGDQLLFYVMEREARF
jgi:translation initiation factor IF-2